MVDFSELVVCLGVFVFLLDLGEEVDFALIDVFSPCVTFNKDNGYAFFRPRLKKLEDEGHDSSDWKSACERALEWGDTIYTGIFLQREAPTLGDLEPVLEEGGPLAHRPLGISQEDRQRIVERMM